MTDIAVRRGSLSDVAELRANILGWSSTSLDMDLDPSACQFVAVNDDELVVGCASVVQQACEGVGSDDAYRLYGVAVLEQYRSAGTGTSLLLAAEHHARRNAAEVLWANARLSAVSFYLARGYTTVGSAFVDEKTGLLDRRVAKQLG